MAPPIITKSKKPSPVAVGTHAPSLGSPIPGRDYLINFSAWVAISYLCKLPFVGFLAVKELKEGPWLWSLLTGDSVTPTVPLASDRAIVASVGLTVFIYAIENLLLSGLFTIGYLAAKKEVFYLSCVYICCSTLLFGLFIILPPIETVWAFLWVAMLTAFAIVHTALWVRFARQLRIKHKKGVKKEDKCEFVPAQMV